MKIGKIFKHLDRKYKSKNFSNLQYDSKKCDKGDIFFAIKGTKINGNKFIDDAITNGAKTIVSNLKFKGLRNNILFVHSKNPRKLISEISSKIYYKKPINLVGVTGTNGKSSIADFFFQILKLNGKKVASIGTLGIKTIYSNLQTSNTTLDSLSINKTLQNLKNKKINNVILEASSHGLKQHRLDGINFNVGIFTNLSRDHLDYHRSYKDYLKSKMILFNKLMKKNANIIFDNEILQSSLLRKISKKKKLKLVTIGKKFSDLKIISHKYLCNKQKVSFFYKNKTYSFQTNLIGKIQINNLIMAILASYKSNLSMGKIINSINKIKPVNGRLEKIGNLNNNSTIILDYAHTPEALKICLQNLKEQFKFSKISIVFGCGGDRDKPKRKIMGKIANDYCHKIYLTDDNPRKEDPKKIRSQIKASINKSKLVEISSREKAIAQSIKKIDSGDILLVAGKGHENYQEYYKRKLFSDRECILKNIKLKNKSLYKDWKLNILKEKIPIIKLKRKQKIKNVSINSKEIKKNDIFFGVKGKKLNGNQYADEAIKKGASIAVIEKNFNEFNKKKIKVNNSLQTLSEYSKSIRKVSNINAIAITGSSGKTSLKELLGQTLNKIASTSYSKKSFNNQYGVPLSLSNIKKNDEFGVFEAGMNKKGEIDKLSKLIIPNLGIITNISYAHIKNFKNLNEIALAKSELINNIVKGGSIVLNKDDEFYNFFKKKALRKKLKIISFSAKKKADIYLKNIVKIKSNYLLYLNIFSKIKKFIIKENLKPYILNILATLSSISVYYNIKNLDKRIFYNFILPKGRGNKFQIKVYNKKINIIDESYNSNPLSLNFAIKNFDKMSITSNRKNILLSDMLELGKFSKKLHKEASKTINKSNINKVFVVGKDIKETFNKIKTQKKGKILKNKMEILSLIRSGFNNNDYLMIKGSHDTGLNSLISKIKAGQQNAL